MGFELDNASRNGLAWKATFTLAVAACLAGLAPAPAAGAEAAAEDTASSDAAQDDSHRVFDQVLVTGGPEAVERIPGSAAFISKEELRRQDYGDVHRILASVPGVNVQDEDGYGLRPNIGMRGTGVERSQKITLLEDGVLIAPAPYAAPAAYYTPTAGRMESVEVRKGSSAISQGPYTNGGVINLVSSGIPSDLAGRLNVAFGEDETLRLHGNVGNSGERFGWMVETYQLDTAGFKKIDGGGDSGVRLEDYMAKFRYASGAEAKIYQAVELKLGATDQEGEETYLGLTSGDFAANPLRRYAASQEDHITTDHKQVQLRYFAQPTARLHLTATLYRNDFFRNWHKLQSVGGRGLSSVLDNPDLFSGELALLRGEVDDLTGALSIRNNRRDYYSEGLEILAGWSLPAGDKIEHSFQFGARVHEDREDRFQEEEAWDMVDGRMRLNRLGDPGSQSNRVSTANATAFFLRDEIALGRWTLTPGVRFESIDFERGDYGKSDPLRTGADLARKENGIDIVLPGFGVGFQVSDAWSVFGGLHRGFAPPGPGQRPETEAEESVNYEFGFNFRRGVLGARIVGFFSDYDNLLGRDTLSAGGEGTGDAFNGGEVDVSGLEATMSYELFTDRSLRAPLTLSYTYTEAKFRNHFTTAFADWSPAVMAGDEVPYLPEHQLSASLGLVAEKWSTYWNLSYTGEMRSKAGQGPIPADTGIDERLLLDLTLNYQVLPGLKAFAQVRNATDETYLVARRPAGARPGLPRTALVGIAWDF